MIAEIVEALNSAYPSVTAVAFGAAELPRAPYVVVKPESDIAERGRGYRIIAHFLPGQQLFLEDYIRGSVGAVLDNFSATNRHGNLNQLYYDAGAVPAEIITGNDDGTISMERVYWMPDMVM